MLVEEEGNMETGLVRQLEHLLKGTVLRKTALIACEMKRYNTLLAAISETKWLNNDIYIRGRRA